MIRGDRTILRAREPADAERIVRWESDPQVMQYMGRRIADPLARVRRRIEEPPDPAECLHLCIDDLGGRHIGTCALMVTDRVAGVAGLGIMIGEKDLWSQGYGTDATLALCGFGFDQMGLHRVFLHVYTFNARAICSYEKCGFTAEGVLRQAVYKLGAFQDVLVMGLLADEYRAAHPDGWP